MNTETILVERLVTERLMLIPFTKTLCDSIIQQDYSLLTKMGVSRGNGWPDQDVLDTIPKIKKNLSLVPSPSGFESWMIVKKKEMEVIGDLGFKGFNAVQANADLGYGIIKDARRKGYACEAAIALLHWAFSQKGVKEITANCTDDNYCSIHLLRKLNFHEIKRENDMLYWTLQKEWFHY